MFDGVLEGCRRAGSSWCDAPHTAEKPKDTKEPKESKEKEQKDAKEAKDK